LLQAKFFGFIPFTIKHSKKGVLRNAVWAYLMTVYGFGLLYNVIDKRNPGNFAPSFDGVISSIYFSITTMATVGFGDFVTKNDIT
jgi:Ion channel